jgi:hypothetical protein
VKKATDTNYVCHREPSIKSITKKHFGLGIHLPTLLAGSKEQVPLWPRASLIVLRDGRFARKYGVRTNSVARAVTVTPLFNAFIDPRKVEQTLFDGFQLVPPDRSARPC